MTINTLNNVLAAAVAGTLAIGGVAPAFASGSIAIGVSARDAETDRAIRTGLQLYSLFNNARTGASIRQNGTGNAAGLNQDGRRNQGFIYQEGRGHNGTIQQTGNDNAYGLFQFGRNTDAHVTQRGDGNSGATFVFGW